jgi:hypothetical protein
MFRWRRKIDELQLWEMLSRRGTRRLANRDARALEDAAERCTGCKHVRQCESDLKLPDPIGGLEEYCPNIMYLRYLDAMQRHDPPSLTGPDT